ncbi:MAG: hypothetical protein M1827_005186 [Pycnora praestabilis]|nr:MAG: hypothetical protein M1827_005186 [Pycnora praestabilis]
MSEGYDPTTSAIPGSPWDSILMSQRDLSIQVPINYVTQPGVSFTSACFANGRYEDHQATTCFSNLLVIGFRRFFLDIYWDEGRQQWSLCPVSVPNSDPSNGTSQTTSTATSLSPITSLATAPLASQIVLSTTGTTQGRVVRDVSTSTSLSNTARQGSSVSSAHTVQTVSTGINTTRATTTTAQFVPSTAVPPTNGTSFESGPYVCTSTLNLSTFTSFLLNYLKDTENTLQAHLIYLVLNVHAAASASSPTAPPLAPTDLPKVSDALNTLLDASLSAFLYTPNQLKADRADLNSSWYSVSASQQPIAEYYNVDVSNSGIHSTPDGWPSESYVESQQGRRVLLGFGSTDPQMENYNYTGDAGIIFPTGNLMATHNVSVTTSGGLTNGCYFQANVTNLEKVNASWASSGEISGFVFPESATDSIRATFHLSLNLTTCGISPLLNQTLQNTTADLNVTGYQSIAQGSVWSWGPDEPSNISQTSTDDNNDQLFRCAIMDPTLSGRWRVDYCSQHYLAACRLVSQPLVWHITDHPISYSSAQAACPENTTFSAPRTGLENTYLLSALQSLHATSEQMIWVDFNSLDVEDCWVTGGANASCPYFLDDVEIHRRAVLVPTIAAVIALVITALTIFVKCNANRRTSRRRKRGENGWDYEG